MGEPIKPPEHCDALLKAELAALLHDIGKLSAKFIQKQAEGSAIKFFHADVVTPDFLGPDLVELLSQLMFSFATIEELQKTTSLADVIVHHHDDPEGLNKLIALIVAKGGGVDGSDSGVDKGTPGRKQKPDTVYRATAFGLEECFKPEVLDALRQSMAEELLQLLREFNEAPEWHTLLKLRKIVQEAYQQALGETRRAANDVTLWDHSYSVASLYKAALAGMLLDGAYREPRDVKWRFFRVGFDGLSLIAKGHTIGDSLGYRETLEDAKDAVRNIVEFDWAIGNEVYRDENGVYFVLPALATPQKQAEYDHLLEDAIRQKVLEVTDGEVVPVVGGEPGEGARGLTRLGPQIAQTDLDVRIPYPADAHPTWPERWTNWPTLDRFLRDTQKSEERKPNLGQCDVCIYQRECAVFEPDGHYPQVDSCPVCQARPKCENQVICPTCGQRRRRRVQPWLAEGRQSTIWIDEVADRNDRVAIIIGRFDLTHWLDGRFRQTYLNTLLTRPLEVWGQRAATKKKRNIAKSTKQLSPLEQPQDASYMAVYSYLEYILQKRNTQADGLVRSFFEKDLEAIGFDELLKSTFERAAEPEIEKEANWSAENLAVLFFRKHPSPARLRRIWTTTENFWQRVVQEILKNPSYYDHFADPKKPGLREARTRRVALFAEGVSLPALAYDAEIGPLRLSVYWDKEAQRFITLDNLQLLLEQTGTSSVEEFHDWLGQRKEIEVEEPITGQARARALRGEGKRRYLLRGSEVLDDNYRPYVPILITPRTFLVLVPGVDAADIVQAIRQKYEAEFSKVKNRLPLHLGVVYFHRRSPLYAAMDAARRMLPVGCRPPETWTLAEDAQPVTLTDGRKGVKLLFDNGIEWTVDTTTGDPTVPDDYYPYFLVAADDHPHLVLKVPDPTCNDGAMAPLVHARDLKAGDRVRIEPSLFDFDFLDTIGRRFEVSYEDGKRRPRQGLGGPRPYLLDHLADFHHLWWLLSGHYADEFGEREKPLTPTQLSNLETLIGTQALEWAEGNWERLKEDPVFREFVQATLANVSRGWWNSLGEEDQEQVFQAACNGTLLDVIELYRKVMKVKPLDKEVD